MQNRIALVTGGCGDIGTAICRHLAELGARVIATYFSSGSHLPEWQSEQKKLGFDITAVHLDVTNFENCQQSIAQLEKDIGPIEILVNNAGITKDVTLRKMDLEQWNEIIHTDLDSLFNVTRQVINGMLDRGYGRIINISSINGQKGQFGQTNYAAAKAGMHGFTKALALEVARKGVTVNTISPGYIEGRMISTVPDNIRAQLIAQTPVGRLGAPEEVAWTVGFLASEKSGFITGSNLSVNGGMHMY